MEKAVERGIKHLVPIGIRHKDHQVVAPYARIVDQNGDIGTGMSFLPVCHRLFDLFRTRHIETQQLCRSPCVPYRFHRLKGSGFIGGIIDDYRIAVLRQTNRHSSSDTPAAARHQRISLDFTRKTFSLFHLIPPRFEPAFPAMPLFLCIWVYPP